MRELCRKGEASLDSLKQAVEGADLAPGGLGLGQRLQHAMTVRGAVSVAMAFFGVRIASEVAGFRASDVRVDSEGGMAVLEIRQQKNDQLGVGRVSRVTPLPSWGGACPVKLTSGWLWFRS